VIYEGYTTGIGGSNQGPIEGTVAGDVFRFKQTNGPFRGEMTVAGEEMTCVGPCGWGILRRVSSSPRPSQ